MLNGGWGGVPIPLFFKFEGKSEFLDAVLGEVELDGAEARHFQ